MMVYAQLGGSEGVPRPEAEHVDENGSLWFLYSVYNPKDTAKLALTLQSSRLIAGVIFVEQGMGPRQLRRFTPFTKTDKAMRGMNVVGWFSRSIPFRHPKELFQKGLVTKR